MGDGRLLFKVDADVSIQIENVGGDLVVEGYEGDELLAFGEDMNSEQSDSNEVTIFAGGDCRMRVPNGASFTIENIGGEARFTGINNTIEIENVGGDLHIREATGVQVDNVSGDLELRAILGDIEIDSVGGDADLRNIEGDIRIDSIGGDTLLKAVTGDIEIDSVGGDLIVATPYTSEVEHEISNIGGDAVFKLGEDSDVRFELPEDVKRIIKVRNARLESEDDHEAIILAEGSATVRIESIGGEILLTRQDDSEVDGILSGFMSDDEASETMRVAEEARQWERQRMRAEQEAMREVERERARAEREAEKLHRQAERVQQEAMRAAERAMNKARGKGFEAMNKARSKGFNFEFDFDFGGKHKNKGGRVNIPVNPVSPVPPVPPVPPRPPRAPMSQAPIDPVSDQERMMILKMVENKQITVEEAERLFAALEGRDTKGQ
ncbi:MAG: hypothetical protein KF716_09030 [Anaerolineae bacterium]|nr:hypothetical protein [Anaerolineae bacterium]